MEVSDEIPCIIHQTAPDDRNRWDPRWEQCQCSWELVCPPGEYKYHMWSDGSLRRLFAKAFPEHLGLFDGYEEHIQRVDLVRAAMLFVHGGLYVDMDVEALSSPFPYLPPDVVTVVGSPYTQNERHQNSMMASPKGHPFWKAMVEEAVRRRGNPEKYRTTWQLTGPQLLDAVVAARQQEVHVLPPMEFNPPSGSPCFDTPDVVTRHYCTSVWTHSMDTLGMALYHATRAGAAEDVYMAVQAGARLDCHDHAGLTPLHLAAMRGDIAVVSTLISLSAPVNALDKNDAAPMHYAVQACSPDVVRLLLKSNAGTAARLRAGSAAGSNPLNLARMVLDDRPRAMEAARQVVQLLEVASKASGSGEAPSRKPRAPPVAIGRSRRENFSCVGEPFVRCRWASRRAFCRPPRPPT